MNGGQLVLDLGHRPALGAEDFLVAPCNAAAVAWIDRWPAWPGPALVVHGPAGCGKSHLTAVWRARSGAAAVAARDLGGEPEPWLGAHRAMLIEDADGGLDESALLHRFTVLAAARGSLLITARTPPAHWAIELADLRSRVVGAPAVAIAPPDDALLGAVLV
ncbi:MAG: HdaA/DnaA family protein, partial [Alphaproteobacteria bacterium]